MALIAKREGLPFGDAKARGREDDDGDGARGASRQLTLHIAMPKEVLPAHRARLEEIATGCPVARSLNADLRVPMRFSY